MSDPGEKSPKNVVRDPKLGMLLILLQTPVQLSAFSQMLWDYRSTRMHRIGCAVRNSSEMLRRCVLCSTCVSGAWSQKHQPQLMSVPLLWFQGEAFPPGPSGCAPGTSSCCVGMAAELMWQSGGAATWPESLLGPWLCGLTQTGQFSSSSSTRDK